MFISRRYQGGIKEVSRIDQGGIKDNIKESSIMVGDVFTTSDLEPIQNQSLGGR